MQRSSIAAGTPNPVFVADLLEYVFAVDITSNRPSYCCQAAAVCLSHASSHTGQTVIWHDAV